LCRLDCSAPGQFISFAQMSRRSDLTFTFRRYILVTRGGVAACDGDEQSAPGDAAQTARHAATFWMGVGCAASQHSLVSSAARPRHCMRPAHRSLRNAGPSPAAMNARRIGHYSHPRGSHSKSKVYQILMANAGREGESLAIEWTPRILCSLGGSFGTPRGDKVWQMDRSSCLDGKLDLKQKVARSSLQGLSVFSSFGLIGPV
jgi:hypothetical protein